MINRRLFNLIPALGLTSSFKVSAEDFPSKPIKIIVPTAAGTASDVVGRYISSKMAESLKQAVIIENKPGANGLIATDYVANSKPDGYTLLNTFAIHYMIQWIMNTKNDALTDFEPIAQFGITPLVLVTSNTSRYKTVNDIIIAARENPGKITYASAASTSTLAAANMENIGNIKLSLVPYKSVPQSLLDTSSGVVDLAFCGMSAGLPLIRSGKIHAIAVTTSQRSSILPDLPTMAEQGLLDYDFSTPIWIFGPNGIKKTISKKLSDTIIDIAKTNEFKDFCFKNGLEVDIKDQARLKYEAISEAEKWKKYIDIAGLGT